MDGALVADLQQALAPDRVRASPLELDLYARDASIISGRAEVVCFPLTASEVQACVRVSRKHDRPFVPRGSGTCLADGSLVMLGGLEPEPGGYDLRGAFVGSEGTMGIATRIAVRLTPLPPAVRTLLLDFTSVEAAAAAVSGIIAAGLVPAALEMMDAEITRAVEDFVHAGFPRDAAAVLLVEVDGLPAGVDAAAAVVDEVGRAHGARTVRVAAEEAERALLWKGRKSAFGAIARIAPNYYLHDAVVPRTRLVEVMRAVYDIAARYDLVMMNVFHAGDGNLHPLIVFDRRTPGVMERVMAAGDASIQACVAAGGVLSGEHGIGLEKRDYMPLIFSADDLDAH